MKVVVFGLGYVGSVTGAGLAALGHHVVGVDVDAGKVGAIQGGRSPVMEPGLAELIAQQTAEGRLSATQDVAAAIDRADVTLICVGTPSTSQGSADLSYLVRVLDDLADAVPACTPPAGPHVLVVRSTVPPGTLDEIVEPAADRLREAGWDVATAMCPEFLREGTGVADFFNPSLVVVGTHARRAGEVLSGLLGYSDQPVHVVPPKTAEALKYACNAFHATKVSFANDMSRVLRPLGVDAREVMDLVCEDTFLNISPTYLRPGFAYGGSCLPKDLRSLIYMARRNLTDVPQLSGTVATNELVVRDVVDRIVSRAPTSVALLGLSFKGNTDDLRESPSLEVAERLVGKGFPLRIYDPIVNPARLVGANREHVARRLPHVERLLTRTPGEALEGCDLALVATRDTESLAALVEFAPRWTFDLSGRLGAEIERMPGYEGIGW